MKELTDSELVKLIDKAVMKFRGQSNELESAIGALMVGRKLGWRPLFLIHSPRTIKKYETILDIRFQDTLPDAGPKAKDSIAWIIGEKVSNFWKLVKGEVADVRTPDWKTIK